MQFHSQYPNSFPWRNGDHFTASVGKGKKTLCILTYFVEKFICISLKMFLSAIGYGETTTVGPWEISCEITPNKEEMKPVFETWEEFLSGNLTYSIKVPKHHDEDLLPLMVIDRFTKISRPPSWKGLDLKVQSTLPLLGHCEKALAGWDETTPTITATVSLKLQNVV
jgi:hypothetical protein